MESISDLQTHGLKFIQDDRYFPFGTDGVELANFATGTKTDRIMDFGCGSGIVPVLLGGKKGLTVNGIEIQPELAALAKRNLEINGLPGEIICGRIQDLKDMYPAGSFDVITSNPPYRKAGSGQGSGSENVLIARHEVAVTLGEVMDAAARLLKSGGKLFMVHITERLSEVIAEGKKRRLEPKILQILRPEEGKKPHIFLVKFIKDGKDGTEVLPERSVLGSTGTEYPD